MPGLGLRPLSFKPTFQKFAGQRCGGVQLHVMAPTEVRSLRSSWALLRAAWRLGQGSMRWRTEPYEFVSDVPAFDLLCGSDRERRAIEAGAGWRELARGFAGEERAFVRRRERFLRYAD